MDRFDYGQILEENPLPSVQRLGLRTNFIFVHNNDSRYTSALVKDWLRNSSIQEMQWPSSSPDFNPIEYLWDVLEDCVKKHHSKNKTELTLHLMEEWSKIELSMSEKLVDSVPTRLNEYTYKDEGLCNSLLNHSRCSLTLWKKTSFCRWMNNFDLLKIRQVILYYEIKC